MKAWAPPLPKATVGGESLALHTVLIVGVGREARALADRLLSEDQPPRMVALDGVEGSDATRWRAERGKHIPLYVISDESSPVPADVAEASIAVMSPGVAMTGSLHAWVRTLGIPMTSGSALFVADHHATMIGVTGSKGKSTTSTLIHQLLVGSGVRAALGGNMGIPLQGLDPQEAQVVELSSYQCHYLDVSPDVVVLTALFPEHLDWHGSQEQYFVDKLSLVSGAPRVVIANGDDPMLREEVAARYPDVPIEWVGQGEAWHGKPEGDQSWLCHGTNRLFYTGNSTVLGRHNHVNMLLALAAADASGGLDRAVVPEVLGTFAGLAHRLERIVDPSGLVFVNDSLATNPQAAREALRSCSSAGMVWLVGGYDRGVDYQPLVDQVVASTPRHILGLPGNGGMLVEKFRSALSQQGLAGEVHLEVMASMKDAVGRARELAGPGDYVVLSPGAPSFGHYRDYAHRAEDFVQSIRDTAVKETP